MCIRDRRRLATAFNTDSGLYEAKEPSDSSVSALATFVGGVDFDADSFFNDVLSIEEPFDKKPSKRQVTERVQINFDDPAWEEVESACEGDRSMDRISDEIEDVIRRIDEDLHENGAPEPPRKDLPGDGSDPNQQQ